MTAAVRKPSFKRAAAIVAACAALLGGCAQTPPRAMPAEPQAAAPTSVEAQRRAVFQLYLQQTLAQDAFYERNLGVTRSMPNFAAIKHGLSAIYTDPVVLDWMTDHAERGTPREQFVGSVAQRMFAGLNRLDDDAALLMLGAIGGMMGRMDHAACEQFLRSTNSDKASAFRRMLAAMTDAEVRGMFEAFRLAMRADITAQPLRAVPSAPSMARVTAALERGNRIGVPAGGDNNCRRSARLVQTVAALSGEERSGAITFVLAVMGLSAQQQERQQPAETRPARAAQRSAV